MAPMAQIEEVVADEPILMQLTPAEIAINPTIADLRGDRSSKEYKEHVKLLAQTILSDKQAQPVIIRARAETTPGDQPYELVAGHCRHAAVESLGEGALLDCKYEELDDEQAMRLARRENIQRRNFAPLDFSNIIKGLKDDKLSTKEIAKELGVSSGTITQAERLLTLDSSAKEDLKAGTLTHSAALDVTPVKQDKQKPVIAKAKQAAVKEAQAKENVRAAKKHVAPKKVVAAEVKVQGKHVRAAIRATPGAVAKLHAPKRDEILSQFEKFGKERNFNTPVTGLFQVLSAWVRGDVTTKQLGAACEDLCDCIVATYQKKELAEVGALKQKAGKNAPVPTIADRLKDAGYKKRKNDVFALTLKKVKAKKPAKPVTWNEHKKAVIKAKTKAPIKKAAKAAKTAMKRLADRLVPQTGRRRGMIKSK